MTDRANEMANEIEDLYSLASENDCTCYSNPDGPCEFCSSWQRAARKSLEIIANSMKAYVCPKCGSQETTHKCSDLAMAELRVACLESTLFRIQTHQGLDSNNCAMKPYEILCECQRWAEEALEESKPCPECNGLGKIQFSGGVGEEWRDCPKCSTP